MLDGNPASPPKGAQPPILGPCLLWSNSWMDKDATWYRIEVCMGMGIPIPMGFPWDSHGNGSSFGLLMGMGMGIALMGMGVAYFIGEK